MYQKSKTWEAKRRKREKQKNTVQPRECAYELRACRGIARLNDQSRNERRGQGQGRKREIEALTSDKLRSASMDVEGDGADHGRGANSSERVEQARKCPGGDEPQTLSLGLRGSRVCLRPSTPVDRGRQTTETEVDIGVSLPPVYLSLRASVYTVSTGGRNAVITSSNMNAHSSRYVQNFNASHGRRNLVRAGAPNMQKILRCPEDTPQFDPAQSRVPEKPPNNVRNVLRYSCGASYPQRDADKIRKGKVAYLGERRDSCRWEFDFQMPDMGNKTGRCIQSPSQ
ncbi:hypothetical protein DFH06DRAFT_1396837 [Mycena polygramma]|nr:hypothetical protein DFH06DRAFT_1396837 [Mycena polygramma]